MRRHILEGRDASAAPFVVNLQVGVRRQHRHLNRKRRVAVIHQPLAQRPDQAPVGMNAHAVHDHHSHAGRGRLGINAEELMTVLLLEVHRLTDDDPGRDFIGPALLAHVVRRREDRAR
jgi:hypothetical protein